MLTHLSVRNYQSLASIDLTLSPFTVIVGPSSSGKSALTRAIRTLASYTRGSSFVSTWAKTATIEARLADEHNDWRGTIHLTRGPKTEDNAYVLTHGMANDQRFTKMGGSVPEEVTEFLGIMPDSPLTFAGQFDRPYLLADSPAEVARTFAALTGVHTVFAAAREANRTRLERSQRLRTRLEDLSAITARVDEFKALQGRIKAQQRAEAHMVTARGIEQAVNELVRADSVLDHNNDVIERTSRILAKPVPSIEQAESLANDRDALDHLILREAAARLSIERTMWANISTLPSLERVEAAAQALDAFKTALRRITASKTALTAAQQALEVTEDDLHVAEIEYTAALRDLGHCPTCGQGTQHIEGSHAHDS